MSNSTRQQSYRKPTKLKNKPKRLCVVVDEAMLVAFKAAADLEAEQFIGHVYVNDFASATASAFRLSQICRVLTGAN